MTSPSPLSRRTALAITLLVAGAFFMEMLDGTVIATALPQMAQSFHASAVDLNIGMTAYLLALAVFIPITGWIADRFGSRAVFSAAILIFTAASFLCGVSQGLWSFTAARLLQGFGGAAMVPVGRLVVLRVTEKKDLMSAMATIVWPGLVAPVLGPPVGGFLVTYASWRWIFLLNIPLGLGAMLAALAIIPNLQTGEKRPLDWIGFVLSATSLSALVYGSDALAGDRPAWQALGLLVAGAVLAGLAARHLKRHLSPLLDFAALKLPTFAVSVLGGSLFRISIGSTPFLLPLLFQLVFGLSAFVSGMLVLCVFAGNLIMKLFTSPILRRFGFRSVLIVNGVLTGASIIACAFLTPSTPLPIVAGVLFAGGAFRSMQFSALAIIQFADVGPAQMTGANTLSSMLSQLTLGLGVVLGAAALNVSEALRGQGPGPPALIDFQAAFVLAGLLALIGLVDAVRLKGSAGRAVSGHKTAGDKDAADTAEADQREALPAASRRGVIS